MIIPSSQWIIGNSEKVQIREDQWLPKSVIGGPANRGDPKMVLELVDEAQMAWKETRIRELFDQRIHWKKF